MTSDALGHPLEGLAWIANNLAARGHTISAGMAVITGGIIHTKFASAGDHAVYTVENLGEVELTVS